MDGHRFDQLTRSIARASNRRGFIKGILGLSGIAVSAAALREREVDAARRGFTGPTLPSPTPTPVPCPAGQIRCAGACVDTLTDPANCGGCGISCGAGNICQGGSCVACRPDISSCSAGSQCCSGYCAIYGASGNQCESCAGTLCSGFECSNLMTDDFNCGVCGNRCAAGSYCWDGVCRTDCFPPYIGGCATNAQCCDPTAYCALGSGSVCIQCADTICGDNLCVDLSSNPQFCGSCSTACDPGDYCDQGSCVSCRPYGYDCSQNSDCCTAYCQILGASGGMCDTCAHTICGFSICANLQTDNFNCGACGNSCPAGSTCQLGICIGGIGT